MRSTRRARSFSRTRRCAVATRYACRSATSAAPASTHCAPGNWCRRPQLPADLRWGLSVAGRDDLDGFVLDVAPAHDEQGYERHEQNDHHEILLVAFHVAEDEQRRFAKAPAEQCEDVAPGKGSDGAPDEVDRNRDPGCAAGDRQGQTKTVGPAHSDG